MAVPFVLSAYVTVTTTAQRIAHAYGVPNDSDDVGKLANMPMDTLELAFIEDIAKHK